MRYLLVSRPLDGTSNALHAVQPSANRLPICAWLVLVQVSDAHSRRLVVSACACQIDEVLSEARTSPTVVLANGATAGVSVRCVYGARQVLTEWQARPIMDCSAAQYATDGALQESIAERCASSPAAALRYGEAGAFTFCAGMSKAFQAHTAYSALQSRHLLSLPCPLPFSVQGVPLLCCTRVHMHHAH